MIRTRTIEVSPSANQQSTEVVLEGQPGVRRVLRWVAFEQVDQLDIVGFVEQDQILEAASNAAQFGDTVVPIDRELQSGEQFSLGASDRSGGGGTAEITLAFEEQRG